MNDVSMLSCAAMDIPPITKEQAIAAYGGNAAALARALNITPSAVYQWQDGPIDERHALKLRFVLKPDVFGDSPAGDCIEQAGEAA